MSKIKFPVVASDKHYYPGKAKCPWCKKNKVFEPHTFAGITGGAMLMNRKRTDGGPDDRMAGFLDLFLHGAHDGGTGTHKNKAARVTIVKDVKGGQFELFFCSTKCLRAFLNYTVDELEIKLDKSR